MITLGTVTINKKAKDMMAKVLDSGEIGQTHYIQEFEERLADFLKVSYVVAVSSGTMADAIALATLKYFNPGKTKVYVPALTFIAQINSVFYNQLHPIFYDYSSEILPYMHDALCYFPVHLLGKPEHFIKTGIITIPILEDACEAFGSKINGKYCGTTGEMGTFSFFPSHSLTTGEGGAIATNEKKYYDVACMLRNHGRKGDDILDKFKFDVIGFNGKMTTMQAIIGLSLIDELPSILERRHKNFLFLGGGDIENEYTVPHGFPKIYPTEGERNKKLKFLTSKGIECRTFFSSIPTQEKAYSYLGYKLGEFPMAEYMGRNALYVPCHQNLTREELKHIKKCLDD